MEAFPFNSSLGSSVVIATIITATNITSAAIITKNDNININ